MGWSEQVPVLVVEVVSPNDTARDIEDKVQLWLKAGVATVWVAHPEMRAVIVRKRGNTATFVQGDQLVTDENLPGFAIPASSFFPS